MWEGWRDVGARVEECGGRGKVCGGRGGGVLGRVVCVGGGQVSRMGLVPFLNFWIPCCQMFAVNICLRLW